jgi:hypothetical protein
MTEQNQTEKKASFTPKILRLLNEINLPKRQALAKYFFDKNSAQYATKMKTQ